MIPTDIERLDGKRVKSNIEEVNFDVVHALCRHCYPPPKRNHMGRVITYACGEVGTLPEGSTPVDENGIPLNVCRACLRIYNSGTGCRVCGATS